LIAHDCDIAQCSHNALFIDAKSRYEILLPIVNQIGPRAVWIDSALWSKSMLKWTLCLIYSETTEKKSCLNGRQVVLAGSCGVVLLHLLIRLQGHTQSFCSAGGVGHERNKSAIVANLKTEATHSDGSSCRGKKAEKPVVP
jgi:hypothetical protein